MRAWPRGEPTGGPCGQGAGEPRGGRSLSGTPGVFGVRVRASGGSISSAKASFRASGRGASGTSTICRGRTRELQHGDMDQEPGALILLSVGGEMCLGASESLTCFDSRDFATMEISCICLLVHEQFMTWASASSTAAVASYLCGRCRAGVRPTRFLHVCARMRPPHSASGHSPGAGMWNSLSWGVPK